MYSTVRQCANEKERGTAKVPLCAPHENRSPPLSQSSDQKLMMMKGLVRFLALAVLALAAKPSSR